MNRSSGTVPAPALLQNPFTWWQHVWTRTAVATAARAEHQHAELAALCDEYRARGSRETFTREYAEKLARICMDHPRERTAILRLITRALAPSSGELAHAVSAMQSAMTYSEKSEAEARLRLALHSPRSRFLALLNLLPDGMKLLLRLREDLLAIPPGRKESGPSARSGREFPPEERCAGRSNLLYGRHLGPGPAAILRNDGQLRLSVAGPRQKSRAFHRRRPNSCRARGFVISRTRIRATRSASVCSRRLFSFRAKEE